MVHLDHAFFVLKPMTMKILLIAFFSLFAQTPNNDLPDAKSGDVYGTEFAYQSADILEIKDAIVALNDNKEVAGKFKAEITEVCSKKGCWLNVDLGNGIEGFVKMDGYAFFLPMNTTGKEVIIDGLLYVEEISVQELQHYAEDAGKSPEEIAKITTPEQKYRLTAKGILIL